MLNTDYKEMLSILNVEKVDYIIVGAYAMAVHGVPRATGDIDIFIRPEKSNAEKVFNALKRFGAPLQQITQDNFEQDNFVLQIGVAPCRIDLLTTIDGVTFDQAKSNQIVVTIEEIDIPFIGLEDLKKNKSATGRPRDLYDVEMLKEIEN